jgi:FkbM family methyltransferase
VSQARRLGWAAASAAVVVVGALAPWARTAVFGWKVDGTSDEAVLGLALASVIALVLYARARQRLLIAVPAVSAAVGLALVVHDLRDPAGPFGGPGPNFFQDGDPAGPFGGPGPNVHLQWGIWVALAGAASLLVSSIALAAQRRRIVADRRGRATAARPAVLASQPDELVVAELASRARQSQERANELLTQLAGRLHAKAAASLAEELVPVRELDYPRQRIWLVLSSPSILSRLRSVEKEPFTVDWIERELKPGDVFYDVGANVGAYSLVAAKASGQAARILAFEPALPSFRDLVKNVEINECAGCVTSLPLALWSSTGLLSLSLRSTKPGAARHRLAAADSGTFPAHAVLGASIDDLVERFGFPAPTHAKIDVDGYELEVLRGAARTLARPEWRSIMIELDPVESPRNRAIRHVLAAAGFDGGTRHERVASRRYPDPDARPDVYWTFRRRS